MEPLRVLVVDDDQDHVELLAEFIIGCGHHAVTAQTAADALAQVASARFDLIFVDFLMPDERGDELVRKLRERGITCRIVVTTGFNTQQARENVRQAGVDEFLLKPFSLAKIRFELEQLVRAAQLS
jgi:CheY-like chemotaxis protein